MKDAVQTYSIILGDNTINIPMTSESERIRKFVYRKNMLEDNFYPQAYEEMEKVYISSHETGLIQQIDDTQNLFRMICEEISKAYAQSPIRTFDEAEQEQLEDLYYQIDIDNIMRQANLYMNAYNDCLLQVGKKDDKPTIRLRTPQNTIVVTDEDLNLIEVYIYAGVYNDSQKWYGYIDKEIFSLYVANPNEVLDHKIEDRQDIENNPYGLNIFIPAHNGYRDNEFWQKYKGDDLVKATIQVCHKLSTLNQLIKFQCFKMLKVEGDNVDQLDGMVLDPSRVLSVEGQNTKIDILSLESNYKMLWDTTKEIITSIATSYGISPSQFNLSSAPTSGFAKQMENLKLDSFIQSQQEIFKKIEFKLFDILKEMGFIKYDTFNIEFESIKYPKTYKEELEEQQLEIQLGKTSMVKILADELDITEDEAKIAYEENLQMLNNKVNSLNMNTTAEALGLDTTTNSNI